MRIIQIYNSLPIWWLIIFLTLLLLLTLLQRSLYVENINFRLRQDVSGDKKILSMAVILRPVFLSNIGLVVVHSFHRGRTDNETDGQQRNKIPILANDSRFSLKIQQNETFTFKFFETLNFY